MTGDDRPQPVTWTQVWLLLGGLLSLAIACWGGIAAEPWLAVGAAPPAAVLGALLVRSEIRAQRWHAFELGLEGVSERRPGTRVP